MTSFTSQHEGGRPRRPRTRLPCTDTLRCRSVRHFFGCRRREAHACLASLSPSRSASRPGAQLAQRCPDFFRAAIFGCRHAYAYAHAYRLGRNLTGHDMCACLCGSVLQATQGLAR